MASKDVHILRMEAMVYNSVAVLCVLFFATISIINVSKGIPIETYIFGFLIGAAGAYAGGKRARKKIKELDSFSGLKG